MLIVSIVAAGMLAVFVVSRRSVGFAGHRTQALDFARETIEELKGRVGGYLWPAGILGRDDLNEGGPYDRDLLAGDFRDRFGGQRSYTVTDIGGDGDPVTPDEDYKMVTVTVTWTEP